MTDDREPFREARALGKAKHHEQRLARARTVEGVYGDKAEVEMFAETIRLRVGKDTDFASLHVTPSNARLLAQVLILAAVEMERHFRMIPENATYTAAEVKVLTAKARQETAEEIADKLETVALNEDLPPEWPHVLCWAAGLVREIGAKEASA